MYYSAQIETRVGGLAIYRVAQLPHAYGSPSRECSAEEAVQDLLADGFRAFVGDYTEVGVLDGMEVGHLRGIQLHVERAGASLVVVDPHQSVRDGLAAWDHDPGSIVVASSLGDACDMALAGLRWLRLATRTRRDPSRHLPWRPVSDHLPKRAESLVERLKPKRALVFSARVPKRLRIVHCEAAIASLEEAIRLEQGGYEETMVLHDEWSLFVSVRDGLRRNVLA